MQAIKIWFLFNASHLYDNRKEVIASNCLLVKYYYHIHSWVIKARKNPIHTHIVINSLFIIGLL